MFDAIFNPYLEHLANSDHGKPDDAINAYDDTPKIELSNDEDDTDMDNTPTTDVNILQEA